MRLWGFLEPVTEFANWATGKVRPVAAGRAIPKANIQRLSSGRGPTGPSRLQRMVRRAHTEKMYVTTYNHIKSKNVSEACSCASDIAGSLGQVAGGLVSTPEF